MHKKTIDNIVWWIPFKKLRNSLRDVLNLLVDIKENNNADSINTNSWNVANDIKNHNLEITKKLFMNIKALSLASDIHKETFSKFRNINKGKDVVLVATGPSLASFKPIENAVYVGVNKAYQYNKIALHYLFVQDSSITRDIFYEISQYEPEYCKKFFGKVFNSYIEDIRISNNDVENSNASEYICVSPSLTLLEEPTYYIDKLFFWGAASVVFSAMQFIFWTNPKKIYLVGCDCSLDGYFNSDKGNSLNLDNVIESWKKIKKFGDTFYPDTEIISVNPVGLQGLFKDVYIDNGNMIDTPLKEDFINFFNKSNSYLNSFLLNNKLERMDANRRDIFDNKRCDFHMDRYLFASKYIENKIVLDCAAGLGYGADSLSKNAKPKKVYGVEINEQSVAYATKIYANNNIEFRVGSILSLPFEDNFFDVFTSFETIEHVENEDKQLQEVKRVLKKDGYYILSTPNNWGLTKYHVKDYDYFSIKLLIEKYFTIEGIYNQNSESNKIMKRQIIKTTEENYNEAECFIIVAVNNK